jgi:acyltransferase
MQNLVPNRINWIDWAKTICMFLVIFGHCHINKAQDFIVQFIYSFHIPLFFILSGLLCKNQLNLKTIKRDFRFLIIPYITFGIITIIFHATTSHNLFYFDSYLRPIESLLTGYSNDVGPIWFLPTLFFCKITFYIIQETKKISKYIYYAFTSVSFAFIYIININDINLPLFMDSALCALPFFMIGNNSNKIITIIEEMNDGFKIVLILIFIGLTMLCSNYNSCVDISNCLYGKNFLIFYVTALSGCAFVIMISLYLNHIKKKIITIISYGTIIILGLHGIVLAIITYNIPHLLGYNLTSYNIFTGLIFSFVSLTICILFIILFDLHFYKLFGLKGHIIKNIL